MLGEDITTSDDAAIEVIRSRLNKDSDFCGNKTLHIAARNFDVELVLLLVSTLKCDTKVKNMNGETPLHVLHSSPTFQHYCCGLSCDLSVFTRCLQIVVILRSRVSDGTGLNTEDNARKKPSHYLDFKNAMLEKTFT